MMKTKEFLYDIIQEIFLVLAIFQALSNDMYIDTD